MLSQFRELRRPGPAAAALSGAGAGSCLDFNSSNAVPCRATWLKSLKVELVCFLSRYYSSAWNKIVDNCWVNLTVAELYFTLFSISFYVDFIPLSPRRQEYLFEDKKTKRNHLGLFFSHEIRPVS